MFKTTQNVIITECSRELSSLKIILNGYLCNLKCSSLDLVIISYWFSDVPRNDRLCTTCGQLGDEHHLFECLDFEEDRKLFLNKKYHSHVNSDDYRDLFSGRNYKRLCKVTRFVTRIMNQFR